MDSGHRLYLHLPGMYLCAIHIVCTWSALQGHKMRRLEARLGSTDTGNCIVPGLHLLQLLLLRDRRTTTIMMMNVKVRLWL